MSEKDYPNERDCEHGHLRRSCPICAAEADYAALFARHNALREAVVWERECRFTRNTMRLWHVWPAQDEAQGSYLAARAEVDRLMEE